MSKDAAERLFASGHISSNTLERGHRVLDRPAHFRQLTLRTIWVTVIFSFTSLVVAIYGIIYADQQSSRSSEATNLLMQQQVEATEKLISIESAVLS